MPAKTMLASEMAFGLAPARASDAARRMAQARLRVLRGRRDSVASAMAITIDGRRAAAKPTSGAARDVPVTDLQYARVYQSLREFLRVEAAAGVVLCAAAVLALIASNSGLAKLYALFLELPVEVRLGQLQIAKPLLLWINDGLMAIFFLLVGLEIKRELVEGELSSLRQAMLPAIAAVGGMAGPGVVLVLLHPTGGTALRRGVLPG